MNVLGLPCMEYILLVVSLMFVHAMIQVLVYITIFTMHVHKYYYKKAILTCVVLILLLHTVLEINFDEADYSTDEDDPTGLAGISLSLRRTQVPFRMEVIPTTIAVATDTYQLDTFLNFEDLEPAQSGEVYVGTDHIYSKYLCVLCTFLLLANFL